MALPKVLKIPKFYHISQGLRLSSQRSDLIRNVGIIAHIDAGKTTTTERMLFYSGYMSSLGEVHDGNTVMDYMDIERDRGITIKASVISFPWKNTNINLIDTPGHVDFTMEVERTLRVLDGAVVIIDGSSGVQPQTTHVWNQSLKYKIPKILFINKLDKVNSSVEKSLKSISDKLGVMPICTQILIPKMNSVSSTFKAFDIVDLVSLRRFVWSSESMGAIFNSYPIESSESIYDSVSEARTQLIDSLCDYDETLSSTLLSFDSYDKIQNKTLQEALLRVSKDERVVITLLGSSYKYTGVQPLLDAIVDFLPSPKASNLNGDFLGLVFKILHDSQKGPLTFLRLYEGSLKDGDSLYNSNSNKWEKVRSVLKPHANEYTSVKEMEAGNIAVVTGFSESITGDTLLGKKNSKAQLPGIMIPSPVIYSRFEASSPSQVQELERALRQLCREDPSLRVSSKNDDYEILVSGMGELHLNIIKDRLSSEYGIDVQVGKPRVAYKETYFPSSSSPYTHHFERVLSQKNHSVTLTLTLSRIPEETPSRLIFSSSFSSFSFPPWVLKALKNGFMSTINAGPTLEAPVIQIQIEVLDLVYSNGIKESLLFSAFSEALNSLLKNSEPSLLEPIMRVEITVDSLEYFGKIRQELIHRRGLLLDTFEENRIEALVPLSSLFDYSKHLRVLTSGKASLSIDFSHYSLMSPENMRVILENERY